MTVLHTRQLVIDIPARASGWPLNLDIRPGQVWGVLGPNGAGKTTLLHSLAGLREPRSGRVLLDDVALSGMPRRRIAQQLGLVFQDRQDSFPATVLETALIGRHPWLSLWQNELPQDLQMARQALVALDIAHLEDRSVSTLSGGERQRVSVATLMTQDPSVWLLDEPTNHLDLHHQERMLALLRRQADAGKSVFMCLHDLNLAARWCSHVLLLYPEGEACWGPADTMLVVPALERLYRQPLISTQVAGRKLFVPVAGGIE
jgi:iron complex transport system ATP-binding protein